jgi:membrane fusion protein (multidrug efflux system)
VTESLSLVGSVLANELVEIKSETEGTVQEIQFKEGQRVEKGDLLLQLDETKFSTALAEAESNYKLSEANFDRAKQLFKDRLISQQDYDQAAAMFNLNQATVDRRKRELKDARIYAPFSGVTGNRNISPGQVISKNTTLAWLVDLDPVKVEINVPERFLSQVRVGQDLELSVAAFADKKFKGKVYFIAPSVDPATRTAVVKAEVPNPEHELKPGMFAGLELTLKIRDNAVVIPEIAINKLLEGDRANVYIVDADSTVRTKEVKLGVRLPGQVEILGGLEGGEKVIVEGIQKVGPGAKVRIAPAEVPQAKS